MGTIGKGQTVVGLVHHFMHRLFSLVEATDKLTVYVLMYKAWSCIVAHCIHNQPLHEEPTQGHNYFGNVQWTFADQVGS